MSSNVRVEPRRARSLDLSEDDRRAVGSNAVLDRCPTPSKVARLQIAPELMACFGGTDNLGYDANNPTRVVVADT